MKWLRRLAGFLLAPVVPASFVAFIISQIPPAHGGVFGTVYRTALAATAVVAIPVLVVFFRRLRAGDFVYSGLVTGCVAGAGILISQNDGAGGIGVLELVLCGAILLGAGLSGWICWAVGYWQPVDAEKTNVADLSGKDAP